MASSMALDKLVCAVTMCMVLGAAPLAHAAISRGQVFTARSSCIGYAKGGGALNSSCCNGVRALSSAAKTTPDRHPTCGCLKSLVRSVDVMQCQVRIVPVESIICRDVYIWSSKTGVEMKLH